VNILPTDSGAAARLQIEQGRADLARRVPENPHLINKQEQGKYQAVLDPLPASPFGIMIKKGGTQLTNRCARGDAAARSVRSVIGRSSTSTGLGYGATPRR